MRLVERVRIRGFRSIRDAELEDVGALTSLVGRNSSGKSNVLRALNVFFNGNTDHGQPLNFDVDHHSSETQRKRRRRKTVSIEVDFSLPTGFKFLRQLKSVGAKLGKRFTVRRTWSLDTRLRLVDHLEVNKGGVWLVDGEDLARQFLPLVHFRYIPNRTVPARALREEARNLAKSLQIRLTNHAPLKSLSAAIEEASSRFLEKTTKAFGALGAPIGTPAFSTPTDLAEMLTDAGFKSRSSYGADVTDEAWGSGHQSSFLLHLLHELDTHYSRFFGWRQAVVWGVEEPESGLHRDLESSLAASLQGWSHDLQQKQQILLTTHSPVFAMAADRGYWVELPGDETTLKGVAIPDLVRQAELRGITGWTQPVLSFPMNPVVLVEGPIDVDVLAHTAHLTGAGSLRFLSLPELDPAVKRGGKDAILAYLKRYSGLIPNRPTGAPLIVLLDWEVSNQELEQHRKAYGADGEKYVLRMDAANAQTSLGADFVGIERFYPPSVVEAAVHSKDLVAALDSGGVWSVSGAQLKSAKGALRSRVLGVSDPDKLAGLRALIEQVQSVL